MTDETKKLPKLAEATIAVPLSTFNEILSTLKFAADNCGNWVIAAPIRRVLEEVQKLKTASGRANLLQ